MAKLGGFNNASDKKSYRERRRGGRDRTAAPFHEDKNQSGLYGEDNEFSTEGLSAENQTVKTPAETKNTKDHNLQREKGADLQQEQGAELASKNRLKDKPGDGLGAGNLPSYGNYIKDQRKYRKHAAKVKEYAQPYKSTFEETNNEQSAVKTEKSDVEATIADSSDSAGTLHNPDSPVKHDETHSDKPMPGKLSEKPISKFSEKPSVAERGEGKQNLKPTSQSPKLQTEPKPKLIDEGSRWSKVKEDGKIADASVNAVVGGPGAVDGTTDKPGSGGETKRPRLKAEPKSQKLQPEKSKLNNSPTNTPETGSRNKLTASHVVSSNNLTDMPTEKNAESIGGADGVNETDSGKLTPAEIPVAQKALNRKKQYSQEHRLKDGERFINTDRPPKLVAKQEKLHDKTDKLTEKGSKLRIEQEETIAAMPTETINHREYVYNEATGKPEIKITPETRTLHQNEARWNNPKFTQRLKNAKGVNAKAGVIGKAAGKKGAALGTAGAVGAVVGVGAAPAVAGALVAKPAIEYGSKLLTNAAHRQVRKDIRQNGDNEVLKVTHWAEQKGERALGRGIRKLNPVAVRRYIKNAPYRRESKLKIRELKNDKKLGLLRVKQDKASGVNHMTGKKSNAITRAWQKRQIKKNYQKAMQAAAGKGTGTFTGLARELARGNPKAIIAMVAKKIAVVAVKFAAKITVLNPLFWKLMALVLLFIIILGSVQACVAIFSPAMAGVGFVSDEDIEFSTRIYSEWETDLAIFVRDSNITEEFPPPAHITSQPGVNGVVVYPLYPYTPPPPFYEYRFEIGMIRHDPMELISYLTAVHGERFDPDSDNPMTRSDLENILRGIFEAQYGIAPGEFDDLITTEEETRFRIERRWEQTGTQPVIIGTNPDGSPIWGTEPIFGYVYHDIYYQFWILTVDLTSRSLSDVLRNRMNADEEMHFDVLNLTGNGRQVLGNPFDFNWIPNITSHYGYRVHPIFNEKRFHLGIDIAAPIGTPLFATHTGVITQVQFSDTGYGNMLRLRGEGSDEVIYYTLFAHLDEILVTNGQEVTQGDLIATVGNTGDSTGPHLHLEVIRPQQQVTVNGETITLSAMHLNPLFAVITWTDEESNEAFRPVPGEGGAGHNRPPFIPEIPPEAMSDERFAAIFTVGSRLLGSRYVWGAAGPNTFDCSGLIHYIFSNAGIGWTHGRTTAQGYFNMSTPVTAENARPGDLVFFTGTHSGAFITHVGIYIGNNNMLHIGGNPAGVEFVSLSNPFWQRHFHAFARV